MYCRCITNLLHINLNNKILYRPPRDLWTQLRATDIVASPSRICKQFIVDLHFAMNILQKWYFAFEGSVFTKGTSLVRLQSVRERWDRGLRFWRGKLAWCNTTPVRKKRKNSESEVLERKVHEKEYVLWSRGHFTTVERWRNEERDGEGKKMWL